MTVRIPMISAGLLASFAEFAVVEVRAGVDKVVFPQNYAKGDLNADCTARIPG